MGKTEIWTGGGVGKKGLGDVAYIDVVLERYLFENYDVKIEAFCKYNFISP